MATEGAGREHTKLKDDKKLVDIVDTCKLSGL